MPGRYRDSHPWPFFGLCITTPRLELRIPDDEDLVELFEAARAGIHAADDMPFFVPWTDGIQEPDAAARFFAYHWTARGAITPTGWSLPFAVLADGRVIGTEELMAEEFPTTRSVTSGSWLTAGAQGRGLGTEMRAAVLQLAFAGLGALEARTSAWVDNTASQRVSQRIGYVPNGEQLIARRGEPTGHLNFRLTRETWSRNQFDGIAVHGLEPCLSLLGAA